MPKIKAVPSVPRQAGLGAKARPMPPQLLPDRPDAILLLPVNGKVLRR